MSLRYNEEALREEGWMHSSDPVDEMEVDEKCPDGIGKPSACINPSCPKCHGTGTISRPLTVGEWCDPRIVAEVMRYAVMERVCPEDGIALPSGGRVRVSKEGK